MARLNAIDEARSLYEKLRGGVSQVAGRVGSFVQKNPLPVAYANQQFQQRVAQPVVKKVQSFTNYQAPLEQQTQNFVTRAGSYLGPQGSQAIQNAFPITQVPYNVGEQVRSAGRIASGKPNPYDLLQVGLSVAGVVKPSVSVGFNKKALTTIRNGYNPEVRNVIGKFAQEVEMNPSGVNRKSLGALGDQVQTIAEATFGKKVANLTNRQLKNLFDTAMEAADRKTAPKGFSVGLQAKPLRSVQEAERLKNIKSSSKFVPSKTEKNLGMEGQARGVALTTKTPQTGLSQSPLPQGSQLPVNTRLPMTKNQSILPQSVEGQGMGKPGAIIKENTSLTGGGNQGSSGEIISQVSNPTDPYFNVNRLNVKPEVKRAVKVAVMETKSAIEKIVGKKLSNAEVINTANVTSKVLHSAVDRQQTLQWEAAMLKARQSLADQAQSGTVTQEFIDALLTIKTQGTDIARKLQSLGIGADPQTTTAKQIMLEAILKETDKVDEVLKAAQGVDFNDFQQSAKFYRQFIKPTREEWIDTLRYNAMLSSPNTHINNISSNIQGTGIVAPIEKTLTGTFDWIRSGVTGGKRQYFAGEGVEYAKGYYSSLGKAAKRFSEVMRGKVMGSYPELRDIPLSAGGKGKTTESILKLPQRLLEAADQFFTTLTSEGSQRSLQYRASKGVNVSDVAKKAGKEAEYRLFRQGFGQESEGPVLKAFEYIPEKIMEAKNSSNPVVRTTAKLSFPFVRIAVNLFKQGVEYSPAGLATIPGAKEKLPQFTKAVMGSMVGVGAAMLASSNRITWAAPNSEKQRQLWDKAGMQEYSVKIGDKWVSYTKLHPVLAFNLATVAGVKQALDNQKIDDGTADTILSTLGNIMRFYADQSYVKNIGDFISATEQGASSLPKMASNYAQQFVPYRAFLGWLARTLDPVQRTTTPDANALQKQMEYFFMQVPGLRQRLPEKTGVTGEPIENKNRFINAVSPARVTTADADYENAYRIQKNLPKLQEAKRQATELFVSGDSEGALKIMKENKIQLDKSDIKTFKTNQTKKAADLFIENKQDGALEIMKKYKIQLSPSDVNKAAKRKAVELYKLGLKDEALVIMKKYKIQLTPKDVE